MGLDCVAVCSNNYENENYQLPDYVLEEFRRANICLNGALFGKTASITARRYAIAFEKITNVSLYRNISYDDLKDCLERLENYITTCNIKDEYDFVERHLIDQKHLYWKSSLCGCTLQNLKEIAKFLSICVKYKLCLEAHPKGDVYKGVY